VGQWQGLWREQLSSSGLFLSLFLPLEIHSFVFKDSPCTFSLTYVSLQAQKLVFKLVKQILGHQGDFFFFLGQMRLFNQIYKMNLKPLQSCSAGSSENVG